MVTYTQVWDPITKRANPDFIRVEDEQDRVYFVSNDPKNLDWLRYKKWRESNSPNSDAPPAEPKAIPSLEVMYDELMILKVKVETLERDLKQSISHASASSPDSIAPNSINGTRRPDNNS